MSDETGTAMVWGGETTSDERLWALIAHLLTFVFPVLGALGVYLIKKDESRFVGYHAMQAVVWQLAIYILGGVTCGVGLLGTFLGIFLALKANNGEWEGYPLIGNVGRSG